MLKSWRSANTARSDLSPGSKMDQRGRKVQDLLISPEHETSSSYYRQNKYLRVGEQCRTINDVVLWRADTLSLTGAADTKMATLAFMFTVIFPQVGG
ncbi:hypothetical protein Y032_0168g189 [Ancylostoma ceylanicum]|uniref:Uncharacterized protein n=1 Tax=Ancylostoma ceylanicum TaxID=53326 RepID=A0A016SWC8_9BILA|nr:hypothetical protein Y032_0168g189 [Ancylostoma ceylanicum]